MLILGANGQLGHELVRACARQSIDYQLVQRVPSPHGLSFDLAQDTDFLSLLKHSHPACVINAAAYTGVDAAENDAEQAMRINALAPGQLAAACRELDIPFVHFSTDYVFSGQHSRAYNEADVCDPLNVYGQSKLRGEQYIREQAGSYFIFRSSWLYSPGRHNFVSSMLRLFTANKPLAVVDDQIGCPTWTYYLAQAVVNFLQHNLTDRERLIATSGTYHLCAQGQTSWYGFACAIAELAHRPPRQTVSATTSSEYRTQAQRPAFSVLDCQKVETTLGLSLPHWRAQLSEAMPEFNALASAMNSP